MKSALVALVLFAAAPALAQSGERRGFIGYSVGPAAPFGAFADVSPTNERDGRAFPGYSSNLVNVVYPVGKRFGVAASGTYSEYVWRDGGDDDWWQMASLAVGPMYTRRLAARAAVDLKAMVGFVALTPVVDGFSSDAWTGSGLAVDLRAAVRYDLTRRWAVFAEGGVQASNVSFDNGDRKDYRAMISGFGLALQPAW
jgi:hypothetical protein